MAIELEQIQPWDGQSGTGSDARVVIDGNFEKIKNELETVDSKLEETNEQIVQLAGEYSQINFKTETFGNLLYSEKRKSTSGDPVPFYDLTYGPFSVSDGIVYVQSVNPSWIRTRYSNGIVLSKPAKLIMPNAYYAYRAYCADDTSGSPVMVHDTGWVNGGNEIILPPSGFNRLFVNFRYASGAADMNEDDITAIQNAFDIYYYKSEEDTYTGSVKMHFESGRLSAGLHKLNDASDFESVFTKFIRTPKILYLKGVSTIKISIPSLSNSEAIYRVGLFDATYNNIDWLTVNPNEQIEIREDAFFANIEVELTGENVNSMIYDGTFGEITYEAESKGEVRVLPGMSLSSYPDGSVRNCYVIKGSYVINSSGSESFTVEESPLDYTASMIRFPQNYDPMGDPVPLIVYFHSTSDYNNIMQNRICFESFQPYIDYLVAEGYAVIDSHAYGHLLSNSANGYRIVTGSQMNVNAYISAIARALDVYNFDRSRVYGLGYSAGGYTGLQMLWKGVKLFNAIAQFAPSVSASRYLGGNSENRRIDFCESAGFVGDYSVLASKGTSNKNAIGHAERTQELIDFYTQNGDKFRQSNPIMLGTINQSLEDMMERALQASSEQPNAFGGGERQSSAYSGISKVAHVPIKIWQAIDDDLVPYEWVKGFVDQLRNGGSVIDFRLIPGGQGGHDAFSVTPVKLSGVTALGIPYENIPFPWIEAVRYFRKYQ